MIRGWPHVSPSGCSSGCTCRKSIRYERKLVRGGDDKGERQREGKGSFCETWTSLEEIRPLSTPSPTVTPQIRTSIYTTPGDAERWLWGRAGKYLRAILQRDMRTRNRGCGCKKKKRNKLHLHNRFTTEDNDADVRPRVNAASVLSLKLIYPWYKEMNIHYIETELPTHISMCPVSLSLSLFHININGLCKSLFYAPGVLRKMWRKRKVTIALKIFTLEVSYTCTVVTV